MIKPSQVAAGVLATLALLLFPVLAFAQDPTTNAAAGRPPANAGGGGQPDPGPAPAKIQIKLKGLKGGKAKVGDRIEAIGTVTPFVPHQKVEIRLGNRGDTVLKKAPWVKRVKGKSFGRFHLRSKPLMDAGKYRVRVAKPATAGQSGGLAKSKAFKLKFIDLDPGDSGPAVELFNQLMRKQGYFDTDKGHYGSHTQRAVLAFRKVNGMARNFNADPTIFKTLAAGKGGFQLKYPNAGKHVEVDISKQVMALADGGKAKYVFHISSGAAATPSDRASYLLPQGPGLQLGGDVLLGLLQPRRTPSTATRRCPTTRRATAASATRSPTQLHLQLDQPRGVTCIVYR